MTVTKFKLLKSFFLITLILALTNVQTRECDINLMKYFDLSGSKFPIKSQMNICLSVEENCCTPSDELKIQTFWNEFSIMKIDRYMSQIFKQYNSILSAHHQIIDVNFDLIEIKRVALKTIPFKFKVCERITLLEDLMDPEFSKLDLLNHNKVLDIPGFDARKLKRGEFKIKGGLKRYATDDSKWGEKNNKIAENCYKIKKRRLNSDNKIKSIHKNRDKISKKTKRKRKERKLLKKEEEENTENGINLSLKKRIEKSAHKFQNNHRLVIKTLKIRDLSLAPEIHTPDHSSLKNKPNYNRKFIFDEELPQRHVQCTTTSKLIHKEITTENNFKKLYCLNLRTKIVNFRIDDFEDYLLHVKVLMLKIIKTKQTFYCALCDNSLQKYIDSSNKIVKFDQEFCRKLVWDYKEYLKFQNIIFIEYTDLIIQYIRCFQTTAEEKTFPYPNFLENFKSQFSYIEKCISHIDNDNFMEHCIYVCDKYSYTSFSPFWDGNPDFLAKVMFIITSFIRKVNSNQPLTIDYQGLEEELKTIEKVDFENPFYDKGHHKKDKRNLVNIEKIDVQKIKLAKKKKLLRKLSFELEDRDIEAENEAKQEHAKVMIERLKNLSNAKPDFREVEESQNSMVYEQRERLPNIKVFQSKFVKDSLAIDPIFMDKNTNFSIDSAFVIQKKCDSERKKFGPLEQSVVQDYFSFSSDDISHFKTDLFLSFADYSLFAKK